MKARRGRVRSHPGPRQARAAGVVAALFAIGVTCGLVAIIAVTFAAPLAGQDYTHPKQMDLPAPDFERPDPDNMRVEMANGLAAYVAVDDRAPLVTLTAFVAAGSAHGAPGEAAVVAAALRRGPSHMSAAAFRATLADMAALYTVTVGREETEIVLEVPAEDAWAAMDLLASTLRDPGFGGAGASGAGRTAQAAGIDFATSLAGATAIFEGRLYQGHPFGRTATGPEMDAARNGGGERFWRTWFVPRNTVLAVAGDFQIIEASARAKEAFEDWTGGDRPDPVDFPSVETAERQVLTAEAAKLQGWVVIGHELPRVPPEDEAALRVMDYILGAYHLDSRLFRESRELRGLTNDNSSFLEAGVRGPGSYSLRTYGRPAVVRLLIDITFRELTKIRTSQPTSDELMVAKGALIDGLYATRYTTGLDAARNYALEWLRTGSHDASASYPDRIAAVTAVQVQEAARRYLDPDRMLIAVLGPLAEISAVPAIETEPPLAAWGRVERVDQGGR